MEEKKLTESSAGEGVGGMGGCVREEGLRPRRVLRSLLSEARRRAQRGYGLFRPDVQSFAHEGGSDEPNPREGEGEGAGHSSDEPNPSRGEGEGSGPLHLNPLLDPSRQEEKGQWGRSTPQKANKEGQEGKAGTKAQASTGASTGAGTRARTRARTGPPRAAVGFRGCKYAGYHALDRDIE